MNERRKRNRTNRDKKTWGELLNRSGATDGKQQAMETLDRHGSESGEKKKLTRGSGRSAKGEKDLGEEDSEQPPLDLLAASSRGPHKTKKAESTPSARTTKGGKTEKRNLDAKFSKSQGEARQTTRGALPRDQEAAREAPSRIRQEARRLSVKISNRAE